MIEDGVEAAGLPERRERLVAAHGEAAPRFLETSWIGLHPLVDERLDVQMPGEPGQQLGAVVRDPRTLGGQGAEIGEAHLRGVARYHESPSCVDPLRSGCYAPSPVPGRHLKTWSSSTTAQCRWPRRSCTTAPVSAAKRPTCTTSTSTRPGSRAVRWCRWRRRRTARSS